MKGRARPSGVDRRLATYRAKRDFGRTPEPSGASPRAETEGSFVVQKHAARRLHYDFRLELDGVLLSWAVPKGPSLRPRERRLAMRTEDHPLEYADFEGIIPRGEYGGGTVIVWDRGRWAPIGDPREGLTKGHLHFSLEGTKLRGRFHLVRTRRDEAEKEAWMLLKSNDDAADDGVDVAAARGESVLSGRTLEQVAEAPERVWHSNRAKGETKAKTKTKPARATAPSRTHAPPVSGDDLLALVRGLPIPFELTNLDRVLYPEQNVRKLELVAYFASVAPSMLPYVAGRPLMLLRCPEGRRSQCFYQKHANASVPKAVRRIELEEENGASKLYMAIDDLAGLVAVPQLGALELHTWMARADAPERPDQLVFDIDPDVGLGWAHVVEAAFELRSRLAAVGLTSFVKTTGGKGLHVVVPLVRRHGWEEHKGFAQALVRAMAKERPDRYTTNARKADRVGRLFLDYLRNGRGATAVAPYSPRAREGAPVAAPVTWKELAEGVDPASFSVYTMATRLRSLREDPWAEYHQTKQGLTAATKRAVGMRST